MRTRANTCNTYAHARTRAHTCNTHARTNARALTGNTNGKLAARPWEKVFAKEKTIDVRSGTKAPTYDTLSVKGKKKASYNTFPTSLMPKSRLSK